MVCWTLHSWPILVARGSNSGYCGSVVYPISNQESISTLVFARTLVPLVPSSLWNAGGGSVDHNAKGACCCRIDFVLFLPFSIKGIDRSARSLCVPYRQLNCRTADRIDVYHFRGSTLHNNCSSQIAVQVACTNALFTPQFRPTVGL